MTTLAETLATLDDGPKSVVQLPQQQEILAPERATEPPRAPVAPLPCAHAAWADETAPCGKCYIQCQHPKGHGRRQRAERCASRQQCIYWEAPQGKGSGPIASLPIQQGNVAPGRTTGPLLGKPLILRNGQSPGDILMLTAAMRDLHLAHPGKFLTAVETPCPALWENNPHVVPCNLVNPLGPEIIDTKYPLIDQSNQRPYHFIHGFHLFLEDKLGVRIPATAFKGDIHLSDQEKNWTSQVQELGHEGPFWIVVAGGKWDFTAKWWPTECYQEVVDRLRGRVTFVQVGDASHWHPRLDGAVDLVGKTDLRQLVRLVYHSNGVLCPVTLHMHLAAAVPTKDGRLRPCVVIAGGREPAHWEQYPGHQYLHTIGAFPCCSNGGCWRSRCHKVGDGDEKDTKNVCERPVRLGETDYPECMMAIRPDDVVRAINLYREVCT